MLEWIRRQLWRRSSAYRTMLRRLDERDSVLWPPANDRKW